MLVLHHMVCKADALRKGLVTFAASALNTCSVVKLVAETAELPLQEPQKKNSFSSDQRRCFSHQCSVVVCYRLHKPRSGVTKRTVAFGGCVPGVTPGADA